MQMQEQTTMLAKDYDRTSIKGKRTKRPKPDSACSSTTTNGGGDPTTGSSSVVSDVSGRSFHYLTLTSGEEEEDMANCLILLAKGRRRMTSPPIPSAAELYRCKTCDKTFSSFQALGGHRASHKKPLIIENKEEREVDRTFLSLKMIESRGTLINKSRGHECSICGTEFASGQALGGHMRRHRPLPPSDDGESREEKKPRKLLLLDLNLPAPEDQLVFSATPLINCHY